MFPVSTSLAIDLGTGEAFRQQKFEAWGTSLAWWANGVGGWVDHEARSQLIGMMFDQTNGLGLNYARYNIGGGQNRLYARNFRPGASVPGWVPNAPPDMQDPATWEWNWDADPRQRLVLDEAISLGVTRVDAISYSAPYWMTNSQDSAGAVGGGSNLPHAHYDELAHYQSEVVQHFHDTLGIRFQAFSPMNEPNASYWQAGGQQEGMHVSQGFDQRLLIESVGQALQSKGAPVGISAAEEFNASGTASAFGQYNATSKSFLTQINTHVYGGNSNNSLSQVRNIAEAEGLRLYQSEYGNNSSTGLQGGIGLASRITQDVNTMGVNGWAYWQAVEPLSLAGAGWGLAWAGYEQFDSDITIRKQYHVMRQYSGHIAPGSHILTTTDANTVAAYDPITETTTVVAMHDGAQPTSKAYDLLDSSPAFSRVIQTAGTQNYVSLGGASPPGAQISINLPGPSVTTLVLHNRPNLIQNAGFDLGGEPSGAGAISGGWQSSGAAVFSDEFDNTGDGSNTAALHANSPGAAGAIWQEGIGQPATDLTGVAYQFSADVLFENGTGAIHDALTQIALEFYGADGQTLAHTDTSDFATPIAPMLSDTQWRTFRTPVVMAPAGTRFVRPIVRLADVINGGSDSVYLDNAYLQEVNFRPRGRHWTHEGNGELTDDSNWEFDVDLDRNKSLYFGHVNAAAATLTLGEDFDFSRLTFDSPQSYRLSGVGRFTLSAEPADDIAIDVRSGSHTIQNNINLHSDADIQVLSGGALTLTGLVDVSGYTLVKQGPGELTFSAGLQLDGGRLQLYAEEVASVTLSNTSVLNGVLEVLLTPGFTAEQGQVFELVEYLGAVTHFDSILMPNLPAGLHWELQYTTDSLQAAVDAVGLAGDYNNDGAVDALDYALWRENLGAPAGTLNNDVDGGPIGHFQYITWRSNFGVSVGEFASVPEPASVGLLLASGATLCSLRRRRKTPTS